MGSCKMKCDECGSDISGSYFETDGKTICKKDYEEIYQKTCSECNKPIEGTYYSKDDKYICAEDYKVCHWSMTISLSCRLNIYVLFHIKLKIQLTYTLSCKKVC